MTQQCLSCMKNNIYKYLLIGIVILGAILRMWHLGQTPPSLNWDEVSLGYNAWSILTTGKDEYGQPMPFILRSYDDYKPGLYSYFLIPFIAILGLTDFAVRFPAAISGTLGIIVVYFLVKEIFGTKHILISKKEIDIRIIALISALCFAISPWDIQFSRIAFESQVGMVLNLLVFMFFLKGLRNGWFFVLSFFCAGLSIHMYQSEKVFIPLILLFLSIVYMKKIWKLKRYYFAGVATAMIVGIPFILAILTNSDVLLRAKGVSVFSDQSILVRSSEKLIVDRNVGYFPGLILDNRRVEFVRQVVSGYLSHFDLNWLFISGDIARHHAPSMGLLYLWQVPVLLIGIYVLFFMRVKKQIKLILIGYLLIVPIPASVTSGVPHAVRTMNFLGVIDIILGLGITQSITFILQQKRLIKITSLIFISVFVLFNFLYYLNQYFVQQNYYNSKDWLYGYKEAVGYIHGIHKNYKNVIVSNAQPLDQSYMFFLFYTQYPPEKYLKEGGTASGGFLEKRNAFQNYIFRPVDWNSESGGDLIVGRPSDIPSSAKILKKVKYLDGESAIVVAEKN